MWTEISAKSWGRGGKKSVPVYMAGVCSLADSLIAGRAGCLLSLYSRIQRNWKNWHSGCVHLCCMEEEHRSVHLCVCRGGVLSLFTLGRAMGWD